MTLLLIDSGNSAIKCRLITQGKVVDDVFPAYQDRDLTGFSHYLKSVESDKIYLASVSSDQITQKIKNVVSHHLSSKVISLNSLAELNGLKNAYDDYRQMGVDRWLTLLAAFDMAEGDCFIIDAGTAIKIEVLSKRHGYLGGAILPGFRTERGRFMQLFPGIDFSDQSIESIKQPGKTTLDCLYIPDNPISINRVIEAVNSWESLLKKPYQLYLTGQDAEKISQHLQINYEVVPDLLFKGMLKQIQLQG